VKRSDLRACQGCHKLTPPENLTFSDGGAELCRGCYGTLASKQATRRARRADEYRRCPACSGVMAPHYDESDDDEGIPLAITRKYDCQCGYGTRLFTLPALVGLGLVGSMTAAASGRAWYAGELDDAAIAGVVMVAVVGALLHNIWLRQRCPRVE
jgi:hypothetical protein